MIETPRLVLRQPRIEDFPATAAMFADPSVVRHIGGRPLSREEAWTRFLRDAGHWGMHGYGLFSIVEKTTGRYVGKTGHARYERDLGPDAGTATEVSWTIEARSQGAGYATEAAKAAQEWFDDRHRHIRRTACLIDPSNAGSIRLAQKLGYAETARFPRGDATVALFVRDTAQQEEAPSP